MDCVIPLQQCSESSIIITSPAPLFTEPNDNIVNSRWELTLRGCSVCTLSVQSVYRCTQCRSQSRSVGAGQLCLAWPRSLALPCQGKMAETWQPGPVSVMAAGTGDTPSVVTSVRLSVSLPSPNIRELSGVECQDQRADTSDTQVWPLIHWPASEGRASVSVCCGQCEGHSEKYFLLWSSWLLLKHPTANRI